MLVLMGGRFAKHYGARLLYRPGEKKTPVARRASHPGQPPGPLAGSTQFQPGEKSVCHGRPRFVGKHHRVVHAPLPSARANHAAWAVTAMPSDRLPCTVVRTAQGNASACGHKGCICRRSCVGKTGALAAGTATPMRASVAGTPISSATRRAQGRSAWRRHGKRRTIGITAQQRGASGAPASSTVRTALSGLQGSMTCRAASAPPHCANSAPGCSGHHSQRRAGNNHPSCFHAAIIGSSRGQAELSAPTRLHHSLDVTAWGGWTPQHHRQSAAFPGARHAHPSAERQGPCAGAVGLCEQEGHHGYEALVGRRGRCSVCGSGRLRVPGHRPRRRAESTFGAARRLQPDHADLRGKVTLVNSGPPAAPAWQRCRNHRNPPEVQQPRV